MAVIPWAGKGTHHAGFDEFEPQPDRQGRSRLAGHLVMQDQRCRIERFKRNELFEFQQRVQPFPTAFEHDRLQIVRTAEHLQRDAGG
ncbi:hypothetical protein SDC9_182099 [bioreactor metagenome]|uniref:Uncharacterized protein n=1 Tax=bioreactor metagenome TaxID=1076179 RepID=A0A645H6J3_9ZZZZ